MKEQIEEMAIEEMSRFITCVDIETEPEGTCCRMNFDQADTMACALYNAGYRKQRENTVEVVRCEECQESEVCPDTLLWCNEWDRLVPPKGFCHCGAKMKGKETTKNHFSPEEVRKMSPKEVRENLAAIMNSMKKWK